MPARDIFHHSCKNALIHDGWAITHDPYLLRWGSKDLYVDLGAKKILAAEKIDSKIAVEVKSFVSPSEVEDLRNAVGQFVLDEALLARTDPERKLYLAIRETIFTQLFEDSLGKVLLEDKKIKLIVFNSDLEAIVRWIS
ncbi:element excision factor XisH family protein [Oscillatoria salina]|uniref:element excision factor XisH family protein n=1 Tax=Oscillatoria salina TaxID=331517 RepID=UPI0013B72308|nr:element excision factor XisH family protein [Oscillatoria salina]MBZ8180101.1 fatty-acid synthase [Oscillatoria salina IIICB1]NET89304.1 fatty-acid synthase [Kamptonema sp. SIO1D9]